MLALGSSGLVAGEPCRVGVGDAGPACGWTLVSGLARGLVEAVVGPAVALAQQLAALGSCHPRWRRGGGWLGDARKYLGSVESSWCSCPFSWGWSHRVGQQALGASTWASPCRPGGGFGQLHVIRRRPAGFVLQRSMGGLPWGDERCLAWIVLMRAAAWPRRSSRGDIIMPAQHVRLKKMGSSASSGASRSTGTGTGPSVLPLQVSMRNSQPQIQPSRQPLAHLASR